MNDASVSLKFSLKFDEAGKPVIYVDAPSPQPPQSRQEYHRKHLPPTILFTGFKSGDKARLEALATTNKLVVCKTVTGGLTFVVGGYNAGPAKLDSAKEEGATILTEQQFLALVSTGEVASNP